MEIDLIKTKHFVFRINGSEYEFVKPYFLMTELKLIRATVKGSTLCWNIEGSCVTYNQIRGSFKNRLLCRK